MKSDFPLLLNSKVIYLDNSSTTQKPIKVIEAITNYYENYNANVHRGIHNLSEIATKKYEEARKTVAKFINAESEEIIFTKGTTDSLNMLASMLKKELKEGDEIVLTEMEHHSNLVPWQQIAKEKKLILKFIPVKDYKLDLEAAKKIISKKTKIISIVHMSNTLGTINPITEIRKLSNALLVVDAAQSVAHKTIDVKNLDCDFLAFSGHKMLGPTGIGVLYGRKEPLEKLDPSQFGGGMIKEVALENSSWADIPERFEAGTPNIAGALGLASAVEYLESLGMDKIERNCNKLSEYAINELEKIKGLKIIGPKKERGPIISFTIEGVHPHDIAEILNKYNIAVRAGHHCTMPLHKKLGLKGTTRASFYIYNTKEDVDALVKGIEKVKEVFK